MEMTIASFLDSEPLTFEDGYPEFESSISSSVVE